MRLESFYNSFDLKENDIKKIYTKEDNLYIILDVSTHLDLMGNGIRPELNVSYEHLFVFKNNGYKLRLSKNITVEEYKYVDNKIILVVNNKTIILDSDPEVIKNYDEV